MSKLIPGHFLEGLTLTDTQGRAVQIPAADGRLTHLQFRRFAGCPICNLHLRGFVREEARLDAAGIQEVAVFHSSAEALRSQPLGAQFALIADPQRTLYRRFGVESSWRSVLHPRAMLAALRGAIQTPPPLSVASEAHLGLPADFLIDAEGRIFDCRYGRHADDHWSLDEVIERAAAATSVQSA